MRRLYISRQRDRRPQRALLAAMSAPTQATHETGNKRVAVVTGGKVTARFIRLRNSSIRGLKALLCQRSQQGNRLGHCAHTCRKGTQDGSCRAE